MDTVLILEGAGGLGKSTFFEILAGDWFCQEKIVIGDKDSKQLAATHWICELGELESFKRAEDSAKKLFFAQRIDKFRPPYGKAPRTSRAAPSLWARPTIGSTSPTVQGNRRYWPLRVPPISIEPRSGAIVIRSGLKRWQSFVLGRARAVARTATTGGSHRASRPPWIARQRHA